MKRHECAACGKEVTTEEAGRCIHRQTPACPVSGWTPAADAAVCQCGHGHDTHTGLQPGTLVGQIAECPRIGCDCPVGRSAFVADVNRPDDDQRAYRTITSAEAHTRHRRDLNRADVEAQYGRPAAVPDREGATEQLADLLAAHALLFLDEWADKCACDRWVASGEDNRADITEHRSHLAAVIVAAGWTRP